MEKNLNNKVVVLDTEQFEALVIQAYIGDGECNSGTTDRIMKHVRRFNPHIAEQHHKEIEAENQQLKGNIIKCREFMKRHKTHDKIFFRAGFDRYEDAEILGPGENKFSIRVKFNSGLTHLEHELSIPIWNLIDVLPDDYVKCQSGNWKGCYVSSKRILHERCCR